MSKLQEQARKNPFVTMLTTVILVGAAFAAFGQVGTYTQTYDDNHTSAAELAVSHPVTSIQLKTIANRSICSTLDLKIAMIEEQIFQMEQASLNSSRLVEKKRLLKKMETQYRTLRCASLLGIA